MNLSPLTSSIEVGKAIYNNIIRYSKEKTDKAFFSDAIQQLNSVIKDIENRDQTASLRHMIYNILNNLYNVMIDKTDPKEFILKLFLEYKEYMDKYIDKYNINYIEIMVSAIIIISMFISSITITKKVFKIRKIDNLKYNLIAKKLLGYTSIKKKKRFLYVIANCIMQRQSGYTLDSLQNIINNIIRSPIYRNLNRKNKYLLQLTKNIPNSCIEHIRNRIRYNAILNPFILQNGAGIGDTSTINSNIGLRNEVLDGHYREFIRQYENN